MDDTTEAGPKIVNFESAGKAVVDNMYKGMALRSRRYDLARASHPVNNTDISSPLVFADAMKMGELKGSYKNFAFPTMAEVSDVNGIPDEKKLQEIRMALAAAPIKKGYDGKETFPMIRDFREYPTGILQRTDNSVMFDNNDAKYGTVSYDPEKLLIALAADLKSPEEDYTIISYPHLDDNRKIKGATILVMNITQRDSLRDKLLQNPRISKPSV